MRKSCVFLLIITLCSSLSFAQSKKSVSIPHSKATCSLIPIVYGIILFRGIRLTLSLYDKLGGINLSKRMIIGFVSIILFRELPFAILDTVRQITPTVPLSLVWMNWDVRMSFLFLVLRMTVGRVLPSENINTADGPKRICTDSVPLWLICSTT